CARDHSDFDSW
nr:immunoglobulin heavy chain junction region [Macaca mulatta]MOW99893.1 immunoglobulin heavy chain junction region [Macaca mulatta]MOX00190.1 immunoglobulin heavy chain junction region [Macaca mulatta]MOX01068.1 immunoglobulin heavy chain junction region [Macaca mulatta]MOX01172.1 immunoglobulin heavy chain junction region [Macaca mulatta]